MKKFLSLILALAMLGCTAFAAEYDIDTDNETVTISGTTSANQTVIISVLKPSATNADVSAFTAATPFFTAINAQIDTAIDETNFESHKAHMVHVTADADGKYSVTLPFALTGSDEVYLLTNSYANGANGLAIYVPSTATVAAAESAINGATAANLVSLIDQYDYVFGLNTKDSVYVAMPQKIADAILVMKGASSYTSFTDVNNTASFKSHFNEALAYYTRQTEAVNAINTADADTLKDLLTVGGSYDYTDVLGTYGGELLNIAPVYDQYGYLNVNRLLVGKSYANMDAFITEVGYAMVTLGEQQTNPDPGTPGNPVTPVGPQGGAPSGVGSVPMGQLPGSGGSLGFTDLDESHWAYDYIMNLVERGVVNGMGDKTFVPDGNVTREQFVKMLLTAFSVATDSSTSSFADVDANAWYAPYVATAAELGIVNGISATEFGVGQPITRQDLVTMIVRACDVYGIQIERTQLSKFDDEGQIADYAYDAVMKLASANIVNGVTEGVFAPYANATRAQVSAIIDRLYNI